MPILKWSKIKIDVDKDMSNKSIYNLKNLFVTDGLGGLENRIPKAYFDREIYLAIQGSSGQSLKLDVISNGDYSEILSYTDEHEVTAISWIDDWDIGTLTTFTKEGVVTGIMFTCEVWQRSGYHGYVRLLEDSVELASFMANVQEWVIKTIEVKTNKVTATYKIQAKVDASAFPLKIRNRHFYFREEYLGIKAE